MTFKRPRRSINSEKLFKNFCFMQVLHKRPPGLINQLRLPTFPQPIYFFCTFQFVSQGALFGLSWWCSIERDYLLLFSIYGTWLYHLQIFALKFRKTVVGVILINKQIDLRVKRSFWGYCGKQVSIGICEALSNRIWIIILIQIRINYDQHLEFSEGWICKGRNWNELQKYFSSILVRKSLKTGEKRFKTHF